MGGGGIGGVDLGGVMGKGVGLEGESYGMGRMEGGVERMGG